LTHKIIIADGAPQGISHVQLLLLYIAESPVSTSHWFPGFSYEEECGIPAPGNGRKCLLRKVPSTSFDKERSQPRTLFYASVFSEKEDKEASWCRLFH